MQALIYAGILACSAALSLLFGLLAVRLAVRSGLLDRPSGHESHVDPVPQLGGMAIVGAFVVAAGAGVALVPSPARPQDPLVIVSLGLLLGLLGFVDDVKGLSRSLRLLVEVTAAVALYAWAEGIHLLGSGPLNVLLTVLWVVGITNAFNLLDNMDGLAAGLAVIASLWFFIIAALNDQQLVAAMAIALAGSALGFLPYNRYPARIYMGDAGSLFLGFMLAATGIKLRFDAPAEVTFFVPVLVLGVAILDTTLVVVDRLRRGRNPMEGGRDHISHRLVRLGLPVPLAVVLIHAASVVVGWLALVMSGLEPGTGWLLIGVVVATGISVVILLGSVPVDEDDRQTAPPTRRVRRETAPADNDRDAEDTRSVLDPLVQRSSRNNRPSP